MPGIIARKLAIPIAGALRRQGPDHDVIQTSVDAHAASFDVFVDVAAPVDSANERVDAIEERRTKGLLTVSLR